MDLNQAPQLHFSQNLRGEAAAELRAASSQIAVIRALTAIARICSGNPLTGEGGWQQGTEELVWAGGGWEELKPVGVHCYFHKLLSTVVCVVRCSKATVNIHVTSVITWCNYYTILSHRLATVSHVFTLHRKRASNSTRHNNETTDVIVREIGIVTFDEDHVINVEWVSKNKLKELGGSQWSEQRVLSGDGNVQHVHDAIAFAVWSERLNCTQITHSILVVTTYSLLRHTHAHTSHITRQVSNDCVSK